MTQRIVDKIKLLYDGLTSKDQREQANITRTIDNLLEKNIHAVSDLSWFDVKTYNSYQQNIIPSVSVSFLSVFYG